MSVARGFGINGKSYYSNVCKPIDVNLNFIVDSANGNGLGVRSIKSNGYVENVFMHTSSTPGPGGHGLVNPNPAVGFIMVQFKNNFNYYLGGFSGFVSPLSGSAVKIDNSAMTIGQPYVISTLGNATLAKWQAIGYPVGFTPAVGGSFIAKTNGGAGNTLTSRVMTPSVSGVSTLEIVGDPNQTIANAAIAPNAGAIVLLQILAPTIASVATTPAVTNAFFSPFIPTAPADNTVIGMCFRFDGSSVTVDGL